MSAADLTTTPLLTGLAAVGPVQLERWFARLGAPPPLDLARSGAPALALRDLVGIAPPGTLDALLDMRLDYGDGAGGAGLREAIAACGAARRANEVLVTNGAVEALLLTCAAVVGRRRSVLVGVPAYEALLRTPVAVGAEVVAVRVWRAGFDRLDLAALHDRVDATVAAVLVNSPANPTGAAAAPADLDALATRCAEVGAVLVVDEVAVTTLDGSAPSASAGSAFARGAVVAIGDVSKSCGLGGLRVGWLATASPSLRAAAARMKDLTTVGNATPSELLATWALEHRAEVVGRVRDTAATNLATLQAWISGRDDGAWLTPPRDGLVAFPFLPAASTTQFLEGLRSRHGVSLVPGQLFGVDGHIRMGLGVASAAFAEALDRLDSALRSPAG
jgi:aspartate/methionine/tyrosine aminotransferase